jgi:hypothetical protein
MPDFIKTVYITVMCIQMNKQVQDKLHTIVQHTWIWLSTWKNIQDFSQMLTTGLH